MNLIQAWFTTLCALKYLACLKIKLLLRCPLPILAINSGFNNRILVVVPLLVALQTLRWASSNAALNSSHCYTMHRRVQTVGMAFQHGIRGVNLWPTVNHRLWYSTTVAAGFYTVKPLRVHTKQARTRSTFNEMFILERSVGDFCHFS